MKTIATVLSLLASSPLVGRAPRVEVTVPKEPITINMNVKIEHEIHIKVDKGVGSLSKSCSDLF